MQNNLKKEAFLLINTLTRLHEGTPRAGIHGTCMEHIPKVYASYT